MTKRSGGKDRTSISIDSRLKQQIDQESEFNLSGFVEATVREYFETGRRPDGLAKRIERKERKIEELRTELEQEEEELERLRERKEEREERSDPELEKAVETLQNMREEKRELDNPALQTQARKVGVPAKELAKAAWGEDFFSEA